MEDFSAFAKLFEDMQQKHRLFIITTVSTGYNTDDTIKACEVYEEAKMKLLDHIKERLR